MWILRGVNKFILWYLLLAAIYGALTTKIKAHNRWFFDELLPPATVRELTSVTLVIAHPDDEVMFFSPTLAQFNDNLPLDVPINVVCMTSGNANGLGQIRKQELVESLRILFHGRRFSCNVLDFEDGMDVTWDRDQLLTQLTTLISDSNPLVLTFDQYGVSGHINHISCAEIIKDLPYKNKLYLRSDQPIYVKYSAFLTGLFKLAVGAIKTDYEKPRFFMSTLPQYILSAGAMSLAHVSQMVWFRVGWWLFSRFCFINDFVVST